MERAGPWRALPERAGRGSQQVAARVCATTTAHDTEQWARPVASLPYTEVC
ncbi:hypothetical protein [Kitasatospora sp. NPDC088346]|uniref:hypothetical protein n=1 Tax=Kitasatospora sp. NPDC088346 TaxID=3364073 RepID=UPI00380C5860